MPLLLDVLAVSSVAPKVTSASFLLSMTAQMSLFAVDASNLIASFFEMTDYVFWDDEKGWRIFLMRRREGIDDGLTR